MIELNGKYTNAIIYADTIEEGVISQVQQVLNHPIFKDCKIRIMPDVHVGKGCTIGFTSEMPKNGDEIKKLIEATAEIYDHLVPVYNYKA